jgi:ABC-type multidrug transport system ATPase subunit
MQISPLVSKNLKLLSRKNYLPVVVLVSPLLLLINMLLLQSMADSALTQVIDPEPQVEKIGQMGNIETIKIGFTHGSVEWTDFVVKDMKKQLINGKIVEFPELNQTEFQDELKKDQKSIGICFCTEEINIGNNTVPCAIPESESEAYIYVIVYNFTYPNQLFITDFVQNEVLAVKMIVDNSIAAWVSSFFAVSNAKLEVEIQSFPRIDRYFSNYNIVATAGASYLVLTSFLLSALAIEEIIKEKSQFLKVFLSLHQVSQFDYWASWVVLFLCMSFLCALQVPLFGSLLGFQEFLRIPWVLQIILFFLINTSGVLSGCLAAVSIKDLKLGNTLSLSFVIVGLCIQFIVCSKGVIQYVHYLDQPFWVALVKVLLYLYPPFNFASVYFKLFNTAGVHFEPQQMAWVDGRDVAWKDLFLSETGKSWAGREFHMPGVWLNLTLLLASAFLYLLILTYLDMVLPHNRTDRKKWSFFLRTQELPEDFENVEELAESLLKNKLALVDIVKKYKLITALDGVSLMLDDHQVLAVVGENGAGKSSLLNILAGIDQPSSGKVECISKRLCPQENVFWDVLTVQEHFELFHQIYREKDSGLLSMVGLENQRNTPAGCLSGGMKRRLSLALSVFGNPEVLLLDEPTAGLDPIIKRQVWKVVDSLSQGRILIFTTHSMEEVNILADSCLWLKSGKIFHFSPLSELKNTFESQYKVEINYKSDNFPNEIRSEFGEITEKFIFESHSRALITLEKSSMILERLTHFLDKSSSVKSWSLTRCLVNLHG